MYPLAHYSAADNMEVEAQGCFAKYYNAKGLAGSSNAQTHDKNLQKLRWWHPQSLNLTTRQDRNAGCHIWHPGQGNLWAERTVWPAASCVTRGASFALWAQREAPVASTNTPFSAATPGRNVHCIGEADGPLMAAAKLMPGWDSCKCFRTTGQH